MANIDPYKTLEVDNRASSEVIKAAYHALIKKFHPDHDGGSEAKSKALNAAYQILSDEDERETYDKKAKKQSGTIIGSYRVLESIAEGGFGATYKAEHLITKDLVCIKQCSMISASHDAVLIQETKSIWDLRHYDLRARKPIALCYGMNGTAV